MSNPCSKTNEFLEMSRKYEPGCMNWQAPVVWDHARGAEIWDVDGKSYIDWTSGVLVANVGHAHPRLAEAVGVQASRLLNPFDFPTPERLRLAQKIVESLPAHLDKVIFVTTGSEAADAALRLVKRYTNKYEIVSFWGGFHGRTFGPMSLSGIPKIRRNYGPLVPGAILVPYPYCYRCPFGKTHPECGLSCLDFIDESVRIQSSGSLAAVIVEPYQGTAGFIFPPPGFLKKLETWARKKGLVFILDEVQASYGRTGTMWALEHEGLEPDVLLLGKGIGSGVPIAAVVTRSEIISCLESGELSSTMGGNPLSCAGALAVFDIIETEGLVEKAAKNGAYLKEKLLGLAAKHAVIGDVRGLGLVMGIEFVKDRATKAPAPDVAKQVVLRCVENGLMVGKLGTHGNVMRVAPPLVITPELIDRSVSILDKVLSGL
ncbi:MAG TPA: aspartate aminotransferase family protein [Candidatus Aminicenantes bacterium]|nr:aspartate aminotransferase family protein [Candidatus Aminicenantes bacterium]HRY65819.1 aspartate aminotransferase family protein [Candidatus Aminicenantes bacterium]HRZ72855.1 aspartate aminotransferase family protein [Candidatus Aminicenantes bacterium]